MRASWSWSASRRSRRSPPSARGADPDAALLAVIDARRGEAFVAGWHAGDDPAVVAPALSPAALAPAALAQAAVQLGPAPLAVGDGAVKFASVLDAAGVAVPEPDSVLHLVSARAHCLLCSVGF